MAERVEMRRLALAAALLAGACVPVPTPTVTTIEAAPDPALARLRPGEAVAVAVRAADDVWSGECLHERLAAALPEARLIAPEAARDAFFPWLEIGEDPLSDATLEAFLASPVVARRLADLRVRYLLLIRTDISDSAGGNAEMWLAGTVGGKMVHRTQVTALDVANVTERAGGTARSAGMQGWAHVLIYGVIVMSFPEAAACRAVADGLVEVLRPTAAASAGAAP